DHRALGHVGMAVDHVLHLGRVDVLAAGDDHVLHPVHDRDVTVVVDDGHVARAEPVTVHHLGGGLGAVPIPSHHVRTGHDHLALLPRLHLAAVSAHTAHVGEDRRHARP